MSAIQVSKGLIQACLGVNGVVDESALSTIQIRFDQLWREAVRTYSNVICIYSDDLEKLANYAKPKDSTIILTPVTLQTAFLEHEVGTPVSDSLVQSINRIPVSLASAAGKSGLLTMAISPQLFHKRDGLKISIHGWIHIFREAKLP